ncbi:energy transducer TonB [Pectobacterium polaris]|uniref:energy transducer TonB n=1 Tax=Pectobacterium polaris TaxID=2042057 RepID=UPI001582C500|nr:energy transducer TonB [Pectobacterium polaris]
MISEVSLRPKRWRDGLRWFICPLLVLGGHIGIAATFLSSSKSAPIIPPQMPTAAPIVVELALPTSTQLVSIDQTPTAPPPEPVEEKIEENLIPDTPVKETSAPINVAVQEKKIPPKKKPEPQKRPPEPKKQESPLDRSSAPASVAKQDNNMEQKSDQNRATQVGAASTLQSQQAKRSWESDILAKLQKEKRYPAYALRSKQQDTVLIRFVIDENGNVLSSAIVKSNGHDLLDRESLALLKRVSPLPPPPVSAMKGGRMELVVPIEFVIRQPS